MSKQPKTLDYLLNRHDMAWAMDVGIRRYRSLPRRADAEGRDRATQLLDNVNGACGELAVARCMNLEWPALVDTYSDLADFPDYDLEVKTTSSPDGGLVIRPQEGRNLRSVYVLVRGLVSPLTLAGWIPGGNVAFWLSSGTLRKLGTAQVIPATHLRDVRELPEALWPRSVKL